MKKKQIKILTVIFSILLLSNFFSGVINIFDEGLFRTYYFQTKNAEFEFTIMPAKGRDVEMMERQFTHFKETHPKIEDLKLYRTFKKNPLKFWNWYAYISKKMFKYEYKKEIDSKSSKGKFGI